MADKKPIHVNDPDYDDPVLAEIWRIRDEMAAEFDYDVGALVRSVREEESRLPQEPFVPRAS